MPTFSNPQIVFNKLESEIGGMTHETLTVTKTATMTNGSLLIADGTEAAAAAAATVAFVIDDRQVDELATGDSFEVSVAKFGCVFNSGELTFSDVAFDPATHTLTALEAAACQFQAIQTI
jgi:hypothetical protein